MADFASRKAYREFADFVKNKARHILDAACESFLDTVLSTSEERAACLKTGTLMWRSQLGHDGLKLKPIEDEDGFVIDTYEEPEPYEEKRMKPRSDRASEGRVNPKGIPCFYFSTDDKTAVAESRPWVGSYVSVSEFQTLRDLKLVDCTVVLDHAGENEQRVWASINRAFTEPVTRSDDVADYAPTQILAEFLRLNGFDGIKYGSELGEGKTIAVFELYAAKCVSRSVYRVDTIDVRVSLASNPHYADDYPTPYQQPL